MNIEKVAEYLNQKAKVDRQGLDKVWQKDGMGNLTELHAAGETREAGLDKGAVRS